MSTLERRELRGTRVLVVDDDADNREMLALLLEHSGAVVVTADCAAEALRVLESEPEHERSQVLISDIGLPGEDGFSLLRKVRTLTRSRGGDIPAIALTGYGPHEDIGPTSWEASRCISPSRSSSRRCSPPSFGFWRAHQGRGGRDGSPLDLARPILCLARRKEAHTMPLASRTRTYQGPERRRNRVFVTLNSEYHCRDGVCVAVVDRHTDEPERDHSAIGRRLTGSLRFDRDRISATSPPETPHEGEQLCFSSGDRDDPHDLVTSTLVRIERPLREVVARYPAQQAMRS